jgi:phage baseplate assembly protein W
MSENTSFLGRGWSFPPRFDGKLGQLELVEMDEDVREALFVLFSTKRGERPTNPTYGCRVHDLIWRPINPTTIFLIKEAIEEAVREFEGRIEIQEIHVDTESADGTIFIHLDYIVTKVNVRTNIVFPYYKIEGTDIVAV